MERKQSDFYNEISSKLHLDFSSNVDTLFNGLKLNCMIPNNANDYKTTINKQFFQ